ncbi:MAG: hypothetical protein AAF598_14495, partial [Bacteroidota bacterium]
KKADRKTERILKNLERQAASGKGIQKIEIQEIESIRVKKMHLLSKQHTLAICWEAHKEQFMADNIDQLPPFKERFRALKTP